MGEASKIEWTDHTFNPWWGCQRVSPGCEHCYAETFAKRTGHKVWGPISERRFFGDAHWREPLKWNEKAEREGVRRRVFCASMADVFEDRPELAAPRARLAGLIRETPSLDWLLLTKRPRDAARLWADAYDDSWPFDDEQDRTGEEWMPNIWLGTTVEDRERAEWRIPALLSVPARVRFLSCEPLIEDISEPLGVWLPPPFDDSDPGSGIHWVIVGGESGGGARPFNIEWARSIVAECRAAAVPVFFKQAGAHAVDGTRTDLLRIPSGFTNVHHRLKLLDRKGGDLSEMPVDLRVREFPQVREQSARGSDG